MRELDEGDCAGRALGPAAQRRLVGGGVDDDVACALEMAAIDHGVAGEDQPRAAPRVGRVEADMAIGRVVARVGDALRHGRAAEPVRQDDAARQRQRIGEARRSRLAVVSAQRDHPIALVQVVGPRVVEVDQLASADDRDDRAPALATARRPGVAGPDPVLDDVEPLADREQVLEDRRDLRRLGRPGP